MTFDSDTDLLPYFSRIAWSFGQVDADRRDRPGVARLDDHVDGVGDDAL